MEELELTLTGVIASVSDAYDNRFDLDRIYRDQKDCYAPLLIEIVTENQVLKDVFHLHEHKGDICPDWSENRRFIGLYRAVNGICDDTTVANDTNVVEIASYETECRELVGKSVIVHITDKGVVYKPVKIVTNRKDFPMQQIPTGKYTVRIQHAGKVIAKSGKEYWRVNYQIVDGDYSGRIINILFWDEPSFDDHINAVHRYVKSQGLSYDAFDLNFERSDNAKKYNRLMPKLA